MAQASLRSLAITNLGKSHDFLLKVLDICHKFPGAPGAPSDQDVVAAIVELAKLTQAIIRGAENGDSVSDMVGGPPAGPSTGPSARENDARRQRIILELCLQQAEQSRLKAAAHRDDAEKIRQELKLIAADLLTAKGVLQSSRRK